MKKIGKYDLIREIGRGATATVHLGIDPFTQREVAIKVASPEILKNHERGKLYTHLFLNEASLVGKLSHPHIVQIYDAVVAESLCYIVMEYVQGGTLETYCHPKHLLPIERVVEIIFKCTRALDFANRIGITHRDIKPANILVKANDEPMLVDFGLALNLNKNMDRDSTFITGVGSPSYMSPEQVKGYQLNQKTDLYSLGVVLFQLLTGRLPFRAKNQATLIYRIVNTDAPDVTSLNPNLPEGLNAILKRALEKDLYSRYRNGAEFAKDLAAVRYHIVDDDVAVQDTRHFEKLRKLDFFVEFENVELWEILRISVWRQIAPQVAIIREGEANRLFGMLIEGYVEVSIAGRSLCRLGAGEVIGEVAYLHPTRDERSATVVTLENSLFLEINASALALASEELQERMRTALLGRMIDRMREVNRIAASHGAPAVEIGRVLAPVTPGKAPGGGLDLELAPM